MPSSPDSPSCPGEPSLPGTPAGQLFARAALHPQPEYHHRFSSFTRAGPRTTCRWALVVGGRIVVAVREVRSGVGKREECCLALALGAATKDQDLSPQIVRQTLHTGPLGVKLAVQLGNGGLEQWESE